MIVSESRPRHRAAGLIQAHAKAPKNERPRREPRPLDGKGGAGYPPQPLFAGVALLASASLLDGLAVQREIEAIALDFLGHAQPDEDVDDLENDQRHHAVVDEHR